MTTKISAADTYTITFKLKRYVEQDWCSAVDNELHVGRTSRDALKKQLLAELTDCVERGFLSGTEDMEIEVVALYGKVDGLTEDDAYDDEESEAVVCGVR